MSRASSLASESTPIAASGSGTANVVRLAIAQASPEPTQRSCSRQVPSSAARLLD